MVRLLFSRLGAVSASGSLRRHRSHADRATRTRSWQETHAGPAATCRKQRGLIDRPRRPHRFVPGPRGAARWQPNMLEPSSRSRCVRFDLPAQDEVHRLLSAHADGCSGPMRAGCERSTAVTRSPHQPHPPGKPRAKGVEVDGGAEPQGRADEDFGRRYVRVQIVRNEMARTPSTDAGLRVSINAFRRRLAARAASFCRRRIAACGDR